MGYISEFVNVDFYCICGQGGRFSHQGQDSSKSDSSASYSSDSDDSDGMSFRYFSSESVSVLLCWCFTALWHFSGHFRRGQLTFPHCSWASLLGSLSVLSAHSFASDWQLPFLYQRKGESGSVFSIPSRVSHRKILYPLGSCTSAFSDHRSLEFTREYLQSACLCMFVQYTCILLSLLSSETTFWMRLQATFQNRVTSRENLSSGFWPDNTQTGLLSYRD